MTTEAFVTLDGVVETADGLLVQFKGGETGRLLRQNQRYARIKELFRIGQSLGARVPWPVRIARSPDGLILSAWPAWRGRPFLVEDLAAETECVVYFLLQNTPKMVKHDHPDYPRMLETLMLASAEKRDVFYFEQPGEEDVLADVRFADQQPGLE